VAVPSSLNFTTVSDESGSTIWPPNGELVARVMVKALPPASVSWMTLSAGAVTEMVGGDEVDGTGWVAQLICSSGSSTPLWFPST
jgi:hypothetical protein